MNGLPNQAHSLDGAERGCLHFGSHRPAASDARRWAALQHNNKRMKKLLLTTIMSFGLASASFSGTTNDYPKESWAFAGYANPDAALKTWTWAMSKGDKAAMLRTLAPEAQKQWEKQLARRTESQLKAEAAKAMAKMPAEGYTIRRREVSGGIAILHYSITNSEVTKMELRKIGNDWKVIGQKND